MSRKRVYVPTVEVEPKPLAHAVGSKVIRIAAGFVEVVSRRDAKAILGAIAHERTKVDGLALALRAANDELLELRMRVTPPVRAGRGHPVHALRGAPKKPAPAKAP